MKRRGFTIVEMSIAMLVTGLIATAIAGFTSALTTQWHDGDSAQTLNVSAQQAQAVLDPVVQSARAIGGVFSSPNPGVFLWQFDSLGAADQKPQLAEMSLLEYDPATKTIYLYQADQTQNLANITSALQALTPADAQSASVAGLFKSQTWLKPRRAILGPGRSVDASISIGRVTTASFQNLSAGAVQQLTWSATLQRGESSVDAGGLVTLRAPMAIP